MQGVSFQGSSGTAGGNGEAEGYEEDGEDIDNTEEILSHLPSAMMFFSRISASPFGRFIASFYNSDLFGRQVIKCIHQPIDLPVRCVNLALDNGLLRG